MLEMLGLISVLGQALDAVQQTSASQPNHLITLVFHADPMVQLTLVVLLVLSIVSWAIILAKQTQLKRCEKQTQTFFELFWGAPKMSEIVAKRGARKGPAFQIFQTGQQALETYRTRKEPVERNVRRAFEEEVEQIEYGVPFLAMTASAAPFIGLFGTVWGILNAFWKIGQSGSSSLALVGPHIAEALIATAIGLAAAIPAVIFYNVFVNKIRRFSKDLEDFTDDLVDRIGNEYFPRETSGAKT